MESVVIDVRTGSGPAVVDLTGEVEGFCRGRGDGLVNVFAPHATCGIALIETGAGSDRDLMTAIDHILPRDERWVHEHGSPGHGADHVLPAFVAPFLTVPVFDGSMALGTWQSVVLVDPNRDNPVRKIRLSFLAG
jgi:secondary thiamine-phosphate synthase enzyme